MALPSNAHLIWHPFIGCCRHDYLSPVLVPAPWFFIDFGVVHGTTGLFAWPTAKFPYPPATRSSRGEVLDMGVPMEGCGTDASLMVPHVPVPLNFNWLLLLIILFGSSKIIMASNKTRIACKGLLLAGEDELAVGCCMVPYIPMSLNLQCWDFQTKKLGPVGAPMLTDVVVAPNTVQVGINFSDYLAAMMEWGLEIVLAVLLAGATTGGAKGWEKYSASKVTKAGDKAAAKALKEGADEAGVKAAREAAEAAARKPGKLSNLYHKIADTRYGKQYLIGLAGKLPYKILVANSEWYRDVKESMKRELPEL